MKKIKILILMYFIFGSVSAASFDCKKASTDIERAICDSDEISALDESMANLYVLKRTPLVPEDKSKFIDQQRQWLKSRNNTCRTSERMDSCLVEVYKKRIKEISEYEAKKSIPIVGAPLNLTGESKYEPSEYWTMSKSEVFDAVVEELKKSKFRLYWFMDMDVSFSEATCNKVYSDILNRRKVEVLEPIISAMDVNEKEFVDYFANINVKEFAYKPTGLLEYFPQGPMYVYGGYDVLEGSTYYSATNLANDFDSYSMGWLSGYNEKGKLIDAQYLKLDTYSGYLVDGYFNPLVLVKYDNYLLALEFKKSGEYEYFSVSRRRKVAVTGNKIF